MKRQFLDRGVLDEVRHNDALAVRLRTYPYRLTFLYQLSKRRGLCFGYSQLSKQALAVLLGGWLKLIVFLLSAHADLPPSTIDASFVRLDRVVVVEQVSVVLSELIDR